MSDGIMETQIEQDKETQPERYEDCERCKKKTPVYLQKGMRRQGLMLERLEFFGRKVRWCPECRREYEVLLERQERERDTFVGNEG